MSLQDEIMKPGYVEHVPAVSGTAMILSVYQQVVLNKDLDLDRLERVDAMYQRMVAREAHKAFIAAFSAMQFPVIERKGLIQHDKRKTPYALWEDVNEAIKPVLMRHGFKLNFLVGNKDGSVAVTAVLEHVDGHTETTTMVLPYDNTGAKNAVQSIGSSTSYGKRYTAGALLNLTSRDEDDDGKSGGVKSDPPIDEEQIKQVEAEITKVSLDRERFLTKYQIAQVGELPASRYEAALRDIAAYSAEKTKRGRK